MTHSQWPSIFSMCQTLHRSTAVRASPSIHPSTRIRLDWHVPHTSKRNRVLSEMTCWLMVAKTKLPWSKWLPHTYVWIGLPQLSELLVHSVSTTCGKSMAIGYLCELVNNELNSGGHRRVTLAGGFYSRELALWRLSSAWRHAVHQSPGT